MTTTGEAAQVLARCATYDPNFNEPDPQMVVGWADLFTAHQLDVNDLLAGVRRHYLNSSDRATPAAVIANARDIRQDRAMRSENPDPAAPPIPDEEEQVACRVCDEQGWLLDPNDLYGYAVRCAHRESQWVKAKPGHTPFPVTPSTDEDRAESMNKYWSALDDNPVYPPNVRDARRKHAQ